MSDDVMYLKRKSFDEEQKEPLLKTESVETIEENHSLEVIKNNPVTLSLTKNEIVERVNSSEDIEEVKELTNLFGLSLTKKEIARVSKESDLIDKLLEHAEERIVNRADTLTTDELLDYFKTFQTNVDKSRKTFNDDIDNVSTKISNTHNEININMNSSTTLSRESREKVLDVLQILLNHNNDDIIIDSDEEIVVND